MGITAFWLELGFFDANAFWREFERQWLFIVFRAAHFADDD